MNARQLTSLWEHYAISNNLRLQEADSIATLFGMDEVEIVRNIESAGFVAKRRNMHYQILGDPIFREREVPRMLELATARADGDTSVPDELTNYPARSRAAKQLRVIEH